MDVWLGSTFTSKLSFTRHRKILHGCFLPFFEVHGKNIATLDLDKSVVTIPCLSLILARCPAIREFTLPPQAFIGLNSSIINGLLALRLSMHAIINRDTYDFDHVVNVMEQCVTLLFDKRGSGLKRVQLLGFVVWDFRSRGRWTKENLRAWKGWIERFEKEQIRFEFSDGFDLVRIPEDLLEILQ
jgi:hypothetical protein